MSYRNPRKRRRSKAFPGDSQNEDEQADASLGRDNDIEHEKDEDYQEGAHREETDITQKEREVWEAFREEQYEILEQLPLSLHRSYTLVAELDQEVQNYHQQLLPALQQYIDLRKSLANKLHDTQRADSSIPEDAGSSAHHTGEIRASTSEEIVDSVLQNESGDVIVPDPPVTENVAGVSHPAQTTPAVPPDHSSDGQSSRQLLAHIARLSEEAVRASNEKVSVAQHAYDLVDRYVRDLDRMIKEQETSISLGLRPGTHPAASILPELIIPKSLRPFRPNQSPLQAEFNLTDNAQAPATMEGDTVGIREEEPAPRKISLRSRTGGTDKGAEKVETQALPHDFSKLTLTVPPLTSVQGTEIPVEPNEPRYCYCDQVSYGEMIACDNQECKREWFHLGCAGLERAPSKKLKWYCRECTQTMEASRQRKSR